MTVSAALLLITLDNSVLYTALPTLMRELGASSREGLWIINAYPLVMAGLLLGAGTLGDRIGHRQMFLAGLGIFGVASVLAAYAPSVNLLIAARALLAVGAAVMMPATLALIRITFEDERERNMAIAIWGGISLVGLALGPIVAGVLLRHFWWGSVFLINVPVVVLALILGFIVTPRSQADASKPWDLFSSFLVLLTLSGLVVAIKEAAYTAPVWPILGAACATVAVAGWLFTRRQARLAYPLLDFTIFRNPAFMAGVVAAVVAMFAMCSVQLTTTQRFQLVGGFSPLEAGLLVAALALGALPIGLLGGAFLHKTGLRFLVSGGLMLAAAGVVLTSLSLHADLIWIVASLGLTGAGLGATMSVAASAIMGNAPAQRAGMASSVEEVAFEFGSLLAVSLLGSLLTTLYSAGLELPMGAPAAARAGVAEALELAARDPQGGAALAAAATAAFDRSYLLSMYVIASVLALGAMVTGWYLRSYGLGSSSFSDGASV